MLKVLGYSSGKTSNLYAGISRTEAIERRTSKEIEVCEFGASILLICVLLILTCSANCIWVKPRNLR